MAKSFSEQGEPEVLPTKPTQAEEGTPTKAAPWPQFMPKATDAEVKARLAAEIQEISNNSQELVDKYCILVLYDPNDSISAWHTDRIYSAIKASNSNKE